MQPYCTKYLRIYMHWTVCNAWHTVAFHFCHIHKKSSHGHEVNNISNQDMDMDLSEEP